MAAALLNLQQRFEPATFIPVPSDRQPQPRHLQAGPPAPDPDCSALLIANAIAAAVYGPKGEGR